MEQTNQQPHDRMKDLLDRIKNNEFSARSKNYFRLKLAALIFIASLALITTVFLFSFIIFNIRISGQASFLGFGLDGLTVFILLFPWKLLLIDAVFLLVFQYLLRSFRICYKIPVLYFLLVLLVVLAASGYIVDRFFPVHDQLLRHANQNHLPQPLTGFYRNANMPPAPPSGHNIFRGVILELGTSTFRALIQNPRYADATSTIFTVVLPYDTNIQTFYINEKVFISGPIVEGQIKAVRVNQAPAFKN